MCQYRIDCFGECKFQLHYLCLLQQRQTLLIDIGDWNVDEKNFNLTLMKFIKIYKLNMRFKGMVAIKKQHAQLYKAICATIPLFLALKVLQKKKTFPNHSSFVEYLW